MSSDWVKHLLIDYAECNSERERKQYIMLSERDFLIYAVVT